MSRTSSRPHGRIKGKPAGIQGSTLREYAKIRDALKERIAGRVYRVGELLPSQRSLAREFNVNRATLRKAIALLEEDGVLWCVPGKGTTVRKSPKTNLLVGYLVKSLNDPFHVELIKQLDTILSTMNAGLIVAEGNDIRRLVDIGVTKIILAGQYQSISGQLQGDCDIVSMGLEDFPTRSVSIDNRKGMQLLYDHLRRLGHRRLAFLSSSIIEVPIHSNLRFNYLMEAVKTAEEKKYLVENDYRLNILDDAECKRAIKRILSSAAGPTALICHSDWLAVEVLQQVLSMHVRVPEDVSITGFDNIYLSRFVPVPLTTIEYPKKDSAEKVVRLLFEKQASHLHLWCQPELVVRQSTGPAREK